MTKAHILDEIRRTAAANGGEALGWRRFESETGIRLADWAKHWARWGEAVREAGLIPKDFTAAYDDAVLLERYAGLTRELARLPAVSDLKLKVHNDQSFPSEKVFRRFKSKENLVKQLVEHCRRSGGWDDVLAICDGYRPRSTNEAAEEIPTKAVQFGFVYLMRSGRNYKIGKTTSAGRRERELAIQLPEKATTVHVIRTDDPSGIEDYWHRRFSAKRKNGEWFQLDIADVQAFKRRKFM